MHLQDHIEDYAAKLRGNWRKFQAFGWSTAHDLDDPEEYCIVYTSNRDSGLLDKSNAECIERALAPFVGDDCWPESHNHWAVGHVDGYVIRVSRDGDHTPAFCKWVELQLALADYPSLDDSRLSELEYEAGIQAIEQIGEIWLADDAPEDWAGQVWSWLWDNDQGELESRDDQGPYPSNEAVYAALNALGLVATDDDDARNTPEAS